MEPPYVLLDDARAGGEARLYRDPVAVIEATSVGEVASALARLREARGLHAAGFLSYEAAPALEPALAPPLPTPTPLLWFGLFETWEPVDAAAWLPDPAGALVGAPEPLVAREQYEAQVRAALDLIAAGDLYQVNLSFPATVPILGDPLAAYARLRARAAAGHGAVVATGRHTLLSLSPELFFRLDGDRLEARPMKGTARRLPDVAADRAAARDLAQDAKQRAENLMIVDLMRNDLARVAVAGSVEVPALWQVETYPTVHQLVSTVTARLAPGLAAADVLAAAFPCGSITGAPKVRAMEAIAAIEARPRGPYTGAIGRIDATTQEGGGDAAFNVAIRTLLVDGGEPRATLSLGAGIVADSNPAAEWAECLAKGAFARADAPGFDLVETMAFDPVEGIPLLERHLARMKASADALGFVFDRHDARNELQAATFRLRKPRRVRLLLAASGRVAIEGSPLPAVPAGPLRVALAPLPVSPRDLRLRHKTSARGFYDDARRASAADEVVFVHDGLVTEGSFTSVFVARDDGILVTPRAGPLLPGVLAADLLATGRAVEGEVTPADLAGGFFVGNALRGLMPADAGGASLLPAVAKEPGSPL